MTAERRAPGAGQGGRAIHQNLVMRRVLNPLVVLLGRAPVLYVRGRRSGKRRAVPMDPPFEWEGSRYLVSPLGDGNWARNLRAVGEGELRIGHQIEHFRADELHGAEHDAVVTAYANTIICGCRRYMRMLPDPADHPVFRIEPRR